MSDNEETYYRIVIDTRERKPYNFYGRDVLHKKLETGDYSVEGFEEDFAIERKSLNDYMRSITHDRDRFEEEVERGSFMGNFEVVIEASEEEVRQGDYYADVAPMSAINTAKAWSRPDRYDVSFIWAGNRSAAKAFTLNKIDDFIEKKINN